jgi:hypothetical protein
MVALDMALTGRSEPDCVHMAHGQAAMFEEPERFLASDGYYLSDGGYSRVLFDEEAGTFRLSQVSRDAVKARWSLEIEALAAHAGSVLLAALQGDPPPPRI